MAQAAHASQLLKTETFHYQGKDRRGSPVQGEIKSESISLAKAQLRKQGILAQTVRKKGKPLFGERKKAITPADIAVFSRQLATMMKAGVPLVQSFDIVADGQDNAAFRELIVTLRNDVAGGNSLASALAKHPRQFDDLFCNLVHAGEQSGKLDSMLDRVATYKEKTEALKAKIRKALTYPAAVILVAIIVTTILLIWVVPQFAETFSSFGADLPAFTLLVLKMSQFMQAYWWVVLGSLAAAGFAFREARLRNKKFADQVDALTLRIPIVGPIVKEAVVARFARTLCTTFAAGVPLVEALESVAGAAGNAVYAKAIRQIRDDVTVGTQLNHAIRSTNIFPMMLLHMVAIGEESGALDSMLDKVATHFETEVDNKVDGLTSLLEPLIMAVLGVLVGGLMVAMYLPIFMLGSVM
ncbi:MAG: type II secretion system F family protein [Pseudomonadales bacterium]|jgi:type IV pilus assembly protein PilC|nr:type II secretion system F family protein [Pseudomonadales bacterium]MCP5321907.1 type II secretion system F family protein [Pseudomonadales bacterium]